MTCKYFTYAHIIDHVKQIVRPGMWIAVNGCLEQYKNTRYIRALDIFESLSTGTKHMDVTELAQQVGNTMVTPDQVDYEIDQEPEI